MPRPLRTPKKLLNEIDGCATDPAGFVRFDSLCEEASPRLARRAAAAAGMASRQRDRCETAAGQRDRSASAEERAIIHYITLHD